MDKKTGINGGPVDHIDPDINAYLRRLVEERAEADKRISHVVNFIAETYELPPNWIIQPDGNVISVPPQDQEQAIREALGSSQNRSDLLQ